MRVLVLLLVSVLVFVPVRALVLMLALQIGLGLVLALAKVLPPRFLLQLRQPSSAKSHRNGRTKATASTIN